MSDTEVVSLDLDGTFEAKCGTAADAGDELTAAFDKMTAAAARYKDPQVAEASKYSAIASELDQIAAVQAKIAGFDAQRARALSEQQALLKKMTDDATGETARRAAAQRAKDAEKATKDAEKAEKERAASDKGASFGVDAFAAQALERAGEKIVQAGIELAKAAADLLVSGERLAIEKTSKRETGSAVMDSMGGDYDATVKTALHLGMDPDAAVTEAKKLLNAHFAQTDIEPLLRVKLGMDAKGLDGDGLLKKLETIELKPKVGGKDIDGLAKLGVDAKAVYAELAKELGISVPAAMAKVKAGAVDSAQAVKAIEAATGSQFGALADKLADSVPALAARAKGELGEMFAFDPALLEPIKEVLHNVLDVIEGPAGAEMKGALGELFDNLNHTVLDNFRGPEGKAKLQEFAHDASHSIHEFAQAVKDAKPTFTLLENFVLGLADLAGGESDKAGVFQSLEAAISPLTGTIDTLNGMEAAIEALDGASLDGILASVGGAADGFLDAGLNMARGLADGIAGGASQAIDAAGKMATDALAAAEAALGIASPSTEFAETGDFGAQGMAQGFKESDAPADAAGQMARDAVGAANDNMGGAGAGAGAAVPGGSVVINATFAPQIVLPPGSSAETEAAAARGVAAAYPAFLAMLQRAKREQAA